MYNNKKDNEEKGARYRVKFTNNIFISGMIIVRNFTVICSKFDGVCRAQRSDAFINPFCFAPVLTSGA